MMSKYKEITFFDEDVINDHEFGKYSVPWLLHDHGVAICIVFAYTLQDALDIAVDADKLVRYLIAPEDLKDYVEEQGISYLGNDGLPFDLEGLGIEELPNPKFSFCTLFNHR